MNSKKAIFFLIFAMVMAAPCFSFMCKVSTEELEAGADLIAVGNVVGKECRWDEGGKWIYTYVTLAVDEYVKGQGEGEVVIRYLGGEVGEKGLRVGHMPSFSEGEEVFVFLREIKTLGTLDNITGGKVYGVSGFEQGKYEILTNEAGEKFIRNNSLYQGVDALGITDREVLSTVPLSEFISGIRAIMEGKE